MNQREILEKLHTECPTYYGTILRDEHLPEVYMPPEDFYQFATNINEDRSPKEIIPIIEHVWEDNDGNEYHDFYIIYRRTVYTTQIKITKGKPKKEEEVIVIG